MIAVGTAEDGSDGIFVHYAAAADEGDEEFRFMTTEARNRVIDRMLRNSVSHDHINLYRIHADFGSDCAQRL